MIVSKRSRDDLAVGVCVFLVVVSVILWLGLQR